LPTAFAIRRRVRSIRSLHANEALDPPRSRRDHEDAEDQDRHPRENRADQPEADVAQHLCGVAGLARQLRRLLLELLGDVVLLVQVLERLVVVDLVLDVLDILGRIRGDVGDLIDDRGEECRAEPDRDRQQADVDEGDRHAPPHVALEEVDRAGHRDGQEGGDHQPADRLPKQPEDVEDQHDRSDHEDVAGDDARRGVDTRHADPLYSRRAASFLALVSAGHVI
jgi:hypothetical protein